MNPILVIAGFVALYIAVHRMASFKRERPFGFQPPKKTLWEKIKKRLSKET
jgi:hypothetical protein